MRKTRRRKKKKDASLRVFSVHNNYTLVRDRSFSLFLSNLSFCFRLPFFPGFTLVESPRLYSEVARYATDSVYRPHLPAFPSSFPWTSRRDYYCCSVYSLFSSLPLFFVWSVTIITLVTFFLVYTSLYLVKFSKFTIKITCGFFCQSSGDNLALCNKYTICTR